jgi:hypothetical protein
MRREEKKTPEYVIKAVKAYQKKYDRLSVLLPAGTKNRIRDILTASGFDSVSAFCVSAILEKLEALERSEETED